MEAYRFKVGDNVTTLPIERALFLDRKRIFLLRGFVGFKSSELCRHYEGEYGIIERINEDKIIVRFSSAKVQLRDFELTDYEHYNYVYGNSGEALVTESDLFHMALLPSMAVALWHGLYRGVLAALVLSLAVVLLMQMRRGVAKREKKEGDYSPIKFEPYQVSNEELISQMNENGYKMPWLWTKMYFDGGKDRLQAARFTLGWSESSVKKALYYADNKIVNQARKK